MPTPASIAQQQLADAARGYTRAWKLIGKNVKGIQAVRLAGLHDAARVFARKTDEEWAGEVSELKQLLVHALESHVTCDTSPCEDCKRIDQIIEGST